jgi:hypothetical protein
LTTRFGKDKVTPFIFDEGDLLTPNSEEALLLTPISEEANLS